MAKQKAKEIKKKSGFSIISKSPQEELDKLGKQLSKQNRENKVVSGSKEQKSEEKGNEKEESQEDKIKGEITPEEKSEQGGLKMEKEVEERFTKLEKVINQVAGHIGTLTQREQEEAKKKADAQAQSEIDKRIDTRMEEKTKSLKDSLNESLKKAGEETKKMIEELKKTQTPPEPKKKEELDFDSEEYQNIIAKNVKDRAKPETRQKIAESLTVEERLCLDKGVCPVHIVKQLAEKGFVIKSVEEEEKKEEKRSLI